MSKIEDVWAKISASDEYNNSDDTYKENVRKRFFERTVGSSPAYKGATPDIQAKIYDRFHERIDPSLLTKAKTLGKEAVGAVKDVLPAVTEKLADTIIKPQEKIVEMGKKVGDIPIPKVKEAGEQLAEAGKGLEEMAGQDIEAGKTTKAIAGTAASILTKGAGKLWDLAVPATVGQAALIPVADAGIEMAGATKIGAKIGKVLNTPVESIIGKFRGLKELPPISLNTPLKGLLDDEKAYENKLREMAGLQGNPMYEPFTPEIKTNVSQLHDYRQEKLIDMRAEDPHLKKLSQAEEDVAYQKKLESMPGSQSYKDQPPLVPFKGMLQGGKEGYIKKPPTPKPTAADVIKPDVRASLENIAGMDKPKQPFMQERWAEKAASERGEIIDPDVKKFPERNLSDITQKPGRNILKEINDDLTHIASQRFGPPDTDPDLLNAAKDLRVAVKTTQGNIYKERFGADAHAYLPEVNGVDQVQGFWDELTSKFYSREEAAKMLGWADQKIKQTGGLMADGLRSLHDNFKKLNEKGEIRIGAGGRAPVRAVGQDDFAVLNAAKDLRVAVKTPDGQVQVGNFGESHVEAFGNKIAEAVMDKSEFGLYDNITKKFVSREEAASYLGPKRSALMGQELGDLHRAGTTYLGKQENGLHSGDIADIKKKSTGELLKQLNKEIGEKGHVWADGDPERYDRIKQNIRELLRRAHVVGYDATDEVIQWAERNFISKEELSFIKGELKQSDPNFFDPRPLSEVLQAMKGQKDAKNTLWEKVKDRWTPDGDASKVRTLLTKRYGELAEGHLDSQYFIHNTLKHLTKTEREAMAFKGIAPEAGRLRWPNAQEIIKLVNKPTEGMKMADKALSNYMAEAHSFLSEHFDEVGYVKDYVSLMWDKATDVLLNPAGNEAGTYNPFIQKRSYPNYAAGINAGQQPKTLDIKDIVSIYDKYKIKSVANVRFFDELAKMPTPQGLPAVMPANRAPIGWIKADNVPALVGKRVHPDYLQAVKVITDAPFSNTALRAYDLLAETQRYASLTLSPFHFGSLFINGALSTDIPFKIPLKVLSASGKYIMKEAMADKSEASIWSKVYNAYMDGHAGFIDLQLSKRATRAGLNIGMIGHEQVGKLENFLMSTEAKLNKFYLGKGIRAIRGAMDVFNKPMWDYIHAGTKIMTFQEHLIDNMKKFPDMPVPELERKTASFVNDLDGGEAWETLFVSPQYQKALHRMFFFPDWMVSRLRTLGEVFKPAGLTTLKDATTRSPQAYQAQKFWLRAGLGYYTMANWRNYVNTKKAYGTGHFMWGNDPGKQMDVFSSTDDRGRAIYHNYAPAITSVFQWFHDPIKSLGARFNPNLQLMSEFFTGTTLSNYKIPEDQRTFVGIMKRKGPMVLKGNNDMGLFPASKGMSSYDVVKRFEGVIRNGDDPSVAINYGVQNGYDIEKLFNIAQRNVRGKMRQELYK